MEGSRHEKAALVIAAYAIGITTAFIFFASPTEVKFEDSFIKATDVNSAAVIKAVPAQAAEEAGALTYKEGRLEMNMSDGVHLLSFNPDVSGLKVDVASLSQGFHYGQVTYRLSQDSKFVFFCEQQSTTTDSCFGFVYDIDGDRIYQIIKDGSPVIISSKSAGEAIWTAVGLKIGANYSANESAPWVLIGEDSKLDLQ